MKFLLGEKALVLSAQNLSRQKGLVDPTPSDTRIETLLSTSACKGGPLVFSTSTDGQNLCARNQI